MGSSASKQTGNAPNSRVGGLSYANLLKQLESKNMKIIELKNRVRELESELANYKKMARQTKPIPRFPDDWDDKSMVSLMTDNDVYNSSIAIRAQDSNGADHMHGNMPKVGDHVVAMWGSSKWQYFTATILRFDPASLKYTIEWDDKDPTGRVVDYYNLALDKVPSEDQIGVGSKVLFHQGSYTSQEIQGVTRSGGLRWHQGEITNTTKANDGTKRYYGRHTKGENDGKWVTFKDYSEEFHGYTIDDFRMPPNVFDILDSVSSGPKQDQGEKVEDDEDAIDVFISYAVVNSPSAVKNKEVDESDLPPSYEQAMLDSLCDPRDIVQCLKDMGVKVHFIEKQDDNSLLEIASKLKKTKVFIACLSDEYASNDRCRMEFQYAKKSLHLPVIPIVVGTGSFQWKMTVVGLLIAGELYIHFKDRTVQGFKMNELLRAIKRHIPELDLKNVQYQATGDATFNDLIITPGLTLTGAQLETAKPDIFFSYCWANSYKAKSANQVSEVIGAKWNDPRTIVEKLTNATNAITWVDIKRLESAADGMGMFEQIATAIKDCKAVVACVSNEYADSDNCRMEIQFAASSLAKPLIILIVGKGDQWKETVVGKVAMVGRATIDLQSLQEEKELEEKISEIKRELCKIEGFGVATKSIKGDKEKKKKKNMSSLAKATNLDKVFKAPVPGDHVVSLHQNWGYFMATIVEFDSTDLLYTVDWDDGDPSGRVQSYKDVALDVVPGISEIGIGSIVIFPQGQYGATDGNNTGGRRYHQGKISAIRKDQDGIMRYDGLHTKSYEDGKWTTYVGYSEEFTGLKLEDLRISPNAMDALYACKQAFNI